jgi:hypothetical protein
MYVGIHHTRKHISHCANNKQSIAIVTNFIYFRSKQTKHSNKINEIKYINHNKTTKQ